jgi:chromosome segregation ATPase
MNTNDEEYDPFRSSMPPMLGTAAWYAEAAKQREAEQQPAFNAGAVQAQLDSKTSEYAWRSKEPTKHAAKLDSLEKEIKQLDGDLNRHQATQVQINPNAEELAQVTNKAATVAAQLNDYYRNATYNQPLIAPLEKELEQLNARERELTHDTEPPTAQVLRVDW